MQDLPNGGGGGASCVGLCGRGGGAKVGGGADASIGPRALETFGTPLLECVYLDVNGTFSRVN